MVLVTINPRAFGLITLAMMAVVGCGTRVAGPGDGASDSVTTDSTRAVDQSANRTLREITLEVTGMT